MQPSLMAIMTFVLICEISQIKCMINALESKYKYFDHFENVLESKSKYWKKYLQVQVLKYKYKYRPNSDVCTLSFALCREQMSGL